MVGLFNLFSEMQGKCYYILAVVIILNVSKIQIGSNDSKEYAAQGKHCPSVGKVSFSFLFYLLIFLLWKGHRIIHK